MFHVNWWTLAKISYNIINKENKNALLRSSNNNFCLESNNSVISEGGYFWRFSAVRPK